MSRPARPTRCVRIAPQWTVPLWLPIATIAGLVLLGILAVLLKDEAQVVARGFLIEELPDAPVRRVSIFGQEFYADASDVNRTDILTAMGLSTVAGIGVITGVVLRGWMRGRRRTARAFGVIAAGAMFLALDEALSIHETIGLNMLFLRELPLVDHPDDLFLALYAVVAVVVAWKLRDLLSISATARRWMAAGALIFALAVVIDVLPTEAYSGAEEILELMAAGCLAVGFVLLGAAHAADGLEAQAAAETPRAAAPLQ